MKRNEPIHQVVTDYYYSRKNLVHVCAFLCQWAVLLVLRGVLGRTVFNWTNCGLAGAVAGE
ncbi:MAG: hypothetical protein COA36_07515 [Desulfotalea sp.]|nr:MAG: hypothetical protein COA36_07515 [Desulfotalea sp.]